MHYPIEVTVAIKIKNSISDYEILKEYAASKALATVVNTVNNKDVYTYHFVDNSNLKCVDLTQTSNIVIDFEV